MLRAKLSEIVVRTQRESEVDNHGSDVGEFIHDTL
jgi:hypothetical protein